MAVFVANKYVTDRALTGLHRDATWNELFYHFVENFFFHFRITKPTISIIDKIQ